MSLDSLIAEVDRKVFLIVDHLRAHEAAAVQAWLAEHQDEIEVFPLPCYTPERNGDEYLNNDLKENVNAAGLPHNQNELSAHIMKRALSEVRTLSGACILQGPSTSDKAH